MQSLCIFYGILLFFMFNYTWLSQQSYQLTEKCRVLHSSVNGDARFKAFLNFIAQAFISRTKSMRLITNRKKNRVRESCRTCVKRERWRRCAQLTFPLPDDTRKALCSSAVVSVWYRFACHSYRSGNASEKTHRAMR